MSDQKTKTNQELKTFLDSIPAGDVELFCNQLIARVKTTRVIFRNWRLGVTRIPLLERSLMNEEANKKYNRVIFILHENETSSTTTTEADNRNT